MKYVAIVEPTNTGFSAFLPDLPGCFATGRTMDEIRRNLHEAVNAHVALMREDGDHVPQPQTFAIEVDCHAAHRRTA